MVSAACGTFGAACYSLRASARVRASETGGFAQPPGAMARHVDAAPLLRHLGVAAAPPPPPPATTLKARPKGQVRPPTQGLAPLASMPLVGSPEYEQADLDTRARAREAANWREIVRLWDAPRASPSGSPSRGSQAQEGTSPADTSPAIVLEGFSGPEAPEPSAIPLPRMLGAAAPQPPPPRVPPAWHWPQPYPPQAPLAWPWPQPGLGEATG